jgi:hypothetical protein
MQTYCELKTQTHPKNVWNRFSVQRHMASRTSKIGDSIRDFRARYHLVRNFLKRLRSTRTHNLFGSFGIHRVAQFLLQEADNEKLANLAKEHWEELLSLVMSIISAQSCIMFLSATGSGLEALGILRSILNRTLTLVYLLEDEALIYSRLQQYADWTLLRIGTNLEESQKSSIAMIVITERFITDIERGVSEIQSRLKKSEFDRLKRAHDFLSSEERKRIASKCGLEGHYEHIFAESSAVIHGADVYDRFELDVDGKKILMTHNEANWPLLFANYISGIALLQFARRIDQFDYVKRQINRLVFRKFD